MPETLDYRDYAIAISEHAAEGVPYLAVAGDVDLYTCQVLERMLERVMERGSRQVGVDLSRVDFLDSAGVVVLRQAARRLRREGRRLLLLGASERVCRVFSILNLPVEELGFSA